MDTMVIIGGGAAQYETVSLMVAFVFGSLVVSTIWFFAIGYGAKKLRRFLNTKRAMLIMDVVAGMIMWSAAFYLTRTILLGV
jgi:L-lysine exporter family protein LysE/ArgO